MNDHKNIKVDSSRRKFLRNASVLVSFASVPISFSLAGCELEAQDSIARELLQKELNIWVHLKEDDTVTISNPTSEMGQGSMTALALLIAEEMDLDWSKVNIINSPAVPDLFGVGWNGRGSKSMITVGSRTVRSYYTMLRQVGAQSRYALLKSTANEWSVPFDQLRTHNGFISHPDSGKSISYGQSLAFFDDGIKMPDFDENSLKQPKHFKLIGKINTRVDVPEKSDGSAIYSIDIDLPSMVYGVITRSPVNGSKPKLMNKQELEGMPGIIKVEMLDHGVALIGQTVQDVLNAKGSIEIEWSSAPADEHSSGEAFMSYVKQADQSEVINNMISEDGPVEEAFRNATQVLKADYFNEYVYHAQMEPLNAVANVKDNTAEIWLGTQAPGNARSAIANHLGLKEDEVKVHRTYLGGGFGRRSRHDYAIEAIELSKRIKKPVKLLWTREDDLQYGMYRPLCMQRMSAAINDQGQVVGWKHVIYGTGGGLLGSGARVEFYDFPSHAIGVNNIDHGIRTKHWRAVGHGPNKFAIEAFLDEVAEKTGKDPLEIRLELMKNHPRAKAVLQKAAEMGRWGDPRPDGVGVGLAFAERSDSLAACVCEISLTEDSEIRVRKVWAALDGGVIVHPDNTIAQMEGGIIMGMSSVLKEKVTIKDGKIQQSNFHDYELLRIDEAPEVLEVALIDSTEHPTGIGESGVPIIGGAIANAFANLTGKRLRHMPFTSDRIKEALG
ncbi:xanthine dehydrogenase family protein molybdopterin-binding subunit [Portibacter marinus]|uniref:xanthine dehydrogenase family protein molybdopterin-binding subunit n=1 Tax=Portibacter marinus TaxID=2898660 RepID=UPI001F1594AB|nr:molybdopterin cofactor-binding domain-containing protein [Portibacter marinus]